MNRFIYIICFVFTGIPAFSQVMSSSEFWGSVGDKRIGVNFDNDTYFQTDYYYTNGLEIEIILPVFDKTPFSSIFPQVSENRNNHTGISIAQRLYTPEDINDTLVQFNDRPFAATFELDHFMISRDEISGFELSGRIRFGLMGPAVGGEEIQRKLHVWIELPEPRGWGYQISNAIILNYDFYLNYPLLFDRSWEIGITGGMRGGTLYDDLGIGVNFGLGKNLFRFIESHGFSGSRANKYPKFYLKGDAFLKLVLYNATLQGGLFSTNDPYQLNYSEISPLVFSTNITAGFLWYGVSFSYGFNFLTREIKAGSIHKYGSLNLSVYF